MLYFIGTLILLTGPGVTPPAACMSEKEESRFFESDIAIANASMLLEC